MRYTHHYLPGADDLAWLDQRFHDDAVGVRHQFAVAARIASQVGLGLGRAELGFRGVGRSLDLIVGRGRYRTGTAQIAVAGLVIGSLACPGAGGGGRFLLGAGGKFQVNRVDAQQHLAALDGLPRLDQPFQHLAGNPETQIALHPGGDNAGERSRSGCGLLNGDSAHQQGRGAWVGWRFFTAGDQRQRQCGNERGKNEATTVHRNPEKLNRISFWD
jgi:hypothetical protein